MSSGEITCSICIIAYITRWYSVQRIDQLMVDTVVRLRVRLHCSLDVIDTIQSFNTTKI